MYFDFLFSISTDYTKEKLTCGMTIHKAIYVPLYGFAITAIINQSHYWSNDKDSILLT